MNYKNRQTRKPGQRVHVVTRSVGRFRKTDYEPRAQPVSRPITMPARNLRMFTDADVGLPEDPVAQQAAETYLAAWIGWNLKHEAKAQRVKVAALEVPLDDDSLIIRDVPQVMLDGIASELRRISNRSGGSPEYSTLQA